jgi:hypothetical protein
LSLAT